MDKNKLLNDLSEITGHLEEMRDLIAKLKSQIRPKEELGPDELECWERSTS